MATKHVFNDSEGLVLKALRGAVSLNPSLRLHASSKSVYTSQRTAAKVVLISGGGAGHEPAHAGYTGRGMLTASVSGDIFASPSASQILTCIQLAVAVHGVHDVLFIVNNYTGDRLNFGLAAVRAKGVCIETIVVADDVALCDRPSLVGARGLAGNILICKLLGGAAEQGLSLASLKTLGDALTSNLASIAVGLSHCHVPGRTKNVIEDVEIPDGQCELGLGLHNEPGVCRIDLPDVKELVDTMIGQIMTSGVRKAHALGDENADEKAFVKCENGLSDEVVLFVNNLGGMSLLEMNAIIDEIIQQLALKQIRPARTLLASYMTSLNAPGFSFSLLNISSTCHQLEGSYATANILEFLDACTDATAWVGVNTGWPDGRRNIWEDDTCSVHFSKSSESSAVGFGFREQDKAENFVSWKSLDINPVSVESGIRSACESVLSVEPELTRFDTIVGDGDCGETFSSAAKAVLHALDSGTLIVKDTTPVQLIVGLADLLMNTMGGTSGAIFTLFLSALSRALTMVPREGTFSNIHEVSYNAPLLALHDLSKYTPAQPGDRTLIDALAPFCEALAESRSLEKAVRNAQEGAERTRGMQARFGRATYVKTRDELPPDPGAWGVAALLEGFANGLKHRLL